MSAIKPSAALVRVALRPSKQGIRGLARSVQLASSRQQKLVAHRQFSATPSSLRASPLEGSASASASRGLDDQSASFNPSSSSSSNAASPDTPLVVQDRREHRVGVTWSSGIESRYHNIWLRDHCRCPQCYHPQTKQRQLDTFAIQSNIEPLDVEATTEGLLVHWPNLKSSPFDDVKNYGSQAQASETTAASEVATIGGDSHTSLYPWSWLYANSYAPRLSLGSNRDDSSSSMIMWGKGIAQQPPTVPYEEVMSTENDRGVARWVNKIAQFGFCFVSGVPPTPEETEKLVRRIAFIRETHYGGFWDFTSDLSHGDTAYTNLPLGAHTDTTYFTDPAGLQLFHLLSHTESFKDKAPAQGGESLLVDGFFAAKLLRDVHPEAYRVLSSTHVSTHSAGDDATLITPLQTSGHPILEHDERSGELIRVRYNNDDRSVLRIPEQDVLPFYDALAKWHAILTHADSEYWSQLQPGMPLIFDNHRVLHGRSSFTGARRLCGAYVNHDDYRSRLSVLRKQFPDLDPGAGVRRATVAASVAAAASQSTVADKSATGTAASRLWRKAEPAPTTSASTENQLARRGVWDDGI